MHNYETYTCDVELLTKQMPLVIMIIWMCQISASCVCISASAKGAKTTTLANGTC